MMNTYMLNRSELLLYTGIAVMATAVIAAVILMLIFLFSGKRLRKRLEEEYGTDNIN